MDYSQLDKVRRQAAPLQLDVVESFVRGRIGRREFLKRGTLIGLSLGSMSAIIAACGGGAASPGASGAAATSGASAGASAGGSAAPPWPAGRSASPPSVPRRSIRSTWSTSPPTASSPSRWNSCAP